MSDEVEYSYYQFMKILNYPVYLRVVLDQFNSNHANFLKTLNFSELKGEDLVEAEVVINTNVNARLLTIQIATAQVGRQIDAATESDRFGLESITPKPGYRVYRYKKAAIIVYSFNATEWQLGCYKEFGSDELAVESRIIINRYLSWALSSFGVVGFWGVPVEEGLTVMKRDESLGEAVFFDVRKMQVITMDGKKEMKGRYKIFRLDRTVKKDSSMRTEELISYLSNNSTYIDYEGSTVPIRQSIQTLSKMTEGIIHPKESFVPRTDLSL